MNLDVGKTKDEAYGERENMGKSGVGDQLEIAVLNGRMEFKNEWKTTT